MKTMPTAKYVGKTYGGVYVWTDRPQTCAFTLKTTTYLKCHEQQPHTKRNLLQVTT